MESITFTTSMRFNSRRVMIHVTAQALKAWGASDEPSAMFETFAERAVDIHEIARDLAQTDADCVEVFVNQEVVRRHCLE